MQVSKVKLATKGLQNLASFQNENQKRRIQNDVISLWAM